MKFGSWLVLIIACLSTAALVAQRGGRGGGGSMRPTATSFDSAEYGMRFEAPAGLDLYTPEQPGRYRQLFGQERKHVAILVNPMETEETIDVRFSGKLSEADVRGFRSAVEKNPPQASLPGYEKISLGEARIGVGGRKDAVDYVYNVRRDKLDVTIRQLVFVHKGNGFMIAFTAEQKRFEKANKLFERFLSNVEFR